jgi:hypothetical protein
MTPARIIPKNGTADASGVNPAMRRVSAPPAHATDAGAKLPMANRLPGPLQIYKEAVEVDGGKRGVGCRRWVRRGFFNGHAPDDQRGYQQAKEANRFVHGSSGLERRRSPLTR